MPGKLYLKNPEIWLQFKQSLRQKFTEPLPGKEAHNRMLPFHRLSEASNKQIPGDVVNSSVLLLLFPDDKKVNTAVILRNEYNGAHSGQISLPGGRKEIDDISDYDTALRETNEEIGVDLGIIDFCGKLTSLYIPRSNYMVHPFVATADNRPDFMTDPSEVKQLIEFSLQEILLPGAVKQQHFRFSDNISFDAPGFYVGNHFMWGATAMIFNELIEIVNNMDI